VGYETVKQGGSMKLQEVDTYQDLKEWVDENMTGARVTVDSAGDIVIHTGLIFTMGGYLHETGADE
jgi:hypothetical protein